MKQLRPYQTDLKLRIYEAWAKGHRNVMAVLPTGLGKTVKFCSIAYELAIQAMDKMPTAICVHRKELVQQISLTLAEAGIMHNIIAPRPVILGIIAGHRRLLKKAFYHDRANISVISVDTLNARKDRHDKWSKTVKLWITDEAAHLLKNNKWGKVVDLFPNAIGLGVTATPERLDGKGLGRKADGVFDTMVEGPSTRWGIANGFLCKYKIAVPASDYQDHLKRATAGSDFTHEAMANASKTSRIVGDVVFNYNKFASGKQAIVFASDINSAHKIEKKFIEAGIPAKLLTGTSTDSERLEGMIDFRNKTTKVLINVDLFDEGLDVPGIEVVIHARPTMSFGKFRQMNGRGLRPDGDKVLIIIDHVGNVARHGLPDSQVTWTLDRREKRQQKVNLIRICSNVECNSPYDRTLTECPWCGQPAFVAGNGAGRIGPAQVDGDLFLLDPDTYREMQESTILESPESVSRRVGMVAGKPAMLKALKNQVERIATQTELSETIALWAGKQRDNGLNDRSIHKKFYIEYERTISQALTEPKAEMTKLMEQLK